MINEEQQGGMELHRHKESLIQPKEEVYGDVDVGKDNLKKLLDCLEETSGE